SVLYQNPYSEEPVNIIGLQKISSDQLKQLEGGVGVKLGIMDDGGSDSTYNYEVRMMLLNDFQANPRVTTAEFVGGGGSFKIPGITPDKITYNLGTGIVFKYKDSLHFTIKYDLRIKNKFIGHAGAIAVRYVL
ncbi:MAG: autotransporter domain-containing protein, partial [Gammaproteobacteria bacterium]